MEEERGHTVMLLMVLQYISIIIHLYKDHLVNIVCMFIFILSAVV